MSSKTNKTLFASAARIATPAAFVISALGDFIRQTTNMHIIIDVTEVTATPSVQPNLEGFDPLSGKWYDLVDSITAITGVGTTAIKYGENTSLVANNSNQGFVPEQIRLRMTHADADSITYSVGINLILE